MSKWEKDGLTWFLGWHLVGSHTVNSGSHTFYSRLNDFDWCVRFVSPFGVLPG